MMQIFLDDLPIASTDSLLCDMIERGSTLEEAVRFIQMNLCPPGRVVIGVRCDGRELTGDTLVKTMRCRAQDIERLDVRTGTKGELVRNAMEQASASLEHTQAACQEVAGLIHAGKTVEAVEALSRCLQMWQQIHEAALRSIAFLQIDTEQMTVNDEPFSALIARPRDALAQIKTALDVRDYVLLADVLLYELSEATESWQRMLAQIIRCAEDQEAEEA